MKGRGGGQSNILDGWMKPVKLEAEVEWEMQGSGKGLPKSLPLVP
jgi:hypothetical protein